jgi:hypothetical protein
VAIESGLISPRAKMRQLAVRAAIVLGLFVWLYTGVMNASRYGQQDTALEVIGLGMAVVNGISWGLIVGLILYLMSFAKSTSGGVPPFDATRSRIWYLSAALTGAILGLFAGSAHAQEGVRPATESTLIECKTLYAHGVYNKAVGACNDAIIALIPQITRFKKVMSKQTLSASDAAFADTFCSQMLTITYTQALAEAKLKEGEVGRQSALKAVGWIIYLFGILGDRQDSSSKARVALLQKDQRVLESLYPGVSSEEMKAFKERLGAQ